jgi:hypothetical protein
MGRGPNPPSIVGNLIKSGRDGKHAAFERHWACRMMWALDVCCTVLYAIVARGTRQDVLRYVALVTKRRRTVGCGPRADEIIERAMWQAAKDGNVGEYALLSGLLPAEKSSDTGRYSIGVSRTKGTLHDAAARMALSAHHTAFVRWIHEEHPVTLPPSAAADAAEAGDIDFVEWLHARGYTVEPSAWTRAVREGRTDVLDKASRLGFPISEMAYTVAAGNASVRSLQWLDTNLRYIREHAHLASRVWAGAIGAESLAVMRYLHERGIPPPETALDTLLTQGALDAFWELVARGCAPDAACLIEAAQRGYLDVARYIGLLYDIDEDTKWLMFIKAIRRGHEPILTSAGLWMKVFDRFYGSRSTPRIFEILRITNPRLPVLPDCGLWRTACQKMAITSRIIQHHLLVKPTAESARKALAVALVCSLTRIAERIIGRMSRSDAAIASTMMLEDRDFETLLDHEVATGLLRTQQSMGADGYNHMLGKHTRASALERACLSGYHEAVRFMIRHLGCDARDCCDSNSTTPYALAAYSGSAETIEALSSDPRADPSAGIVPEDIRLHPIIVACGLHDEKHRRECLRALFSVAAVDKTTGPFRSWQLKCRECEKIVPSIPSWRRHKCDNVFDCGRRSSKVWDAWPTGEYFQCQLCDGDGDDNDNPCGERSYKHHQLIEHIFDNHKQHRGTLPFEIVRATFPSVSDMTAISRQKLRYPNNNLNPCRENKKNQSFTFHFCLQSNYEL